VVAEAGLPAGVFGVVFGASIGRDLVLHSRVAACGFTGSTAGGRALFDLAGGRPKPIPFYGELGSVNPAVVTPGALAARGAEIVAGYVGSFTLGTGQFCTKPGLLFLPSGHGLGPALAEAVASVASAPMLDERIRDGFVRGVAELAAHEDVATCASGGDAPAEGAWGTPQLFTTHAAAVLSDPAPLTAEYFGPASLIVEYDDVEQLVAALDQVEGSLTATLHAEAEEDFPVPTVLAELQARAGRVIWNGWPTGVAVVWAMQHGGPWPSTTNSLHTSVGATAIRRWLRPVSYQSVPDALLPAALQDANPWGLPRRVDGVLRLK
jgi:NADP-dependent aldehyde dehydrogenase